MSHSVVIHMLDEEPIVAEIEEIPMATDQVLIVSNARRRDGREVSYILPDTLKVILPWSRIHCVEVLLKESEETVVSFVRE